jgi:hypothetical protein
VSSREGRLEGRKIKRSRKKNNKKNINTQDERERS